MEDLTAFQRDILYVLAGADDPHGLAIKRALEDYLSTDVNHGRLYPNLDTLVDMGLVEKGQKDRRTNEYTLLDRGRRELLSRRDWENLQFEADDELTDALEDDGEDDQTEPRLTA